MQLSKLLMPNLTSYDIVVRPAIGVQLCYYLALYDIMSMMGMG